MSADTITHGTEPVACTSGVNMTVSGTASSTTTGVNCTLRFQDGQGNAGNSNIVAVINNQGTASATWSTQFFQLGNNNARYLFCAQFVQAGGGKTSKDVFLQTGTPP